MLVTKDDDLNNSILVFVADSQNINKDINIITFRPSAFNLNLLLVIPSNKVIFLSLKIYLD